MPDGTVLSWGLAQFGGIGDGSGGNSAAPALKPLQSLGIQNAVGVYASRGADYTQRALLADGRIFAWGAGYLGTAITGYSSVFVPTHASAYGTDNQALTGPEGYQTLKSNGQAALLDTATGSLVTYPTPENMVALASTFYGAHGLDREGRVWSLTYGNGTAAFPGVRSTGVSTFYSNSFSINGNAVYSIANNTEMLPTPLPTITQVVALAATNYVSFALRADGTVWVWGNGPGDLSGGATYPRSYPDLQDPVQVPGLPAIKSIAAGGEFVLALDVNGNVWSWGSNSKGQLGRSAGASSATAGIVTGLTNVTEIAAGRTHALAMRADGNVWAWGENTYGTLGDGTAIDRTAPVQVLCPSGFSGFLNLLSGACAAKASNALSILAFPAGTPAGSQVLVNGVAVTLPYVATFAASSSVALDIAAPVGYAGGRWSGDKDTSSSNVVQMSLTMNRDWSLTPNVYACTLTHQNDTIQNNVSANGVSFAPSVNFQSSLPTNVASRCTWAATSSQTWLRTNPSTGTGRPISTAIVADPNTTAAARQGLVTFNDGPYALTYTINQLAGTVDTTPYPFAFNAATQVPINTVVISNSVVVSGINTNTSIAINGGSGEFSVNGGLYSNVSGTVNLGDVVSVRLTSSSGYSALSSTTLTIGGVSAAFSVTTVAAPVLVNGGCGSANGASFPFAPTTNLCASGVTSPLSGIGPWTWTCQGINGGTNASCSAQLGDATPDAFGFATQTGVPLNAAMTSNTVTITGINTPAPITVSGGTYSIGCTATFVATASTISNNQTVCVRHTSASSNATAVTTTLDVGGVQATFQSVTQLAAGVPNAFAFAPKTNVPVNTMVNFDPITITGLTASATVTVSGGGEYSVGCTGLFTNADGTITNNQTVCVRDVSAVTNDANKSSVLSVGGVRAAFSSVTIGAMIGACTVQPSPGKDTYYGNVYLTTGMPTAEWIHAGGWGDSYRSYVQIDVSGLPAAVDTTTAELQLYVTNASIADPLLRLYRIDSDWTDVGVTIASQPSVTYLAEAPRGATAGTWYHLDITALYKDWKNGTRPNFGVMLEPGYTENSAYTFASSEAPTAAQRPKIVVQSASGACGAPAMTCDMNISGRGGATDQVDGVLLMRYLLGFRGTALTSGLTLTGWRKTPAEIEQFLSLFNYDVDGSGHSDATVDGMILLRLLRGASDAELLNGLSLPAAASVRDATTMRARATACWASMMN